MAWEQARQKIQEGTDHTESVPVPFGDETIELHFRLLNETEQWEIEKSIDKGELNDLDDMDLSDEEERLRELTSKDEDELTDAEERELQELGRKLQAQQSQMLDSMGDDAFDAFMNAGKMALTPSEEDIENAFDLSPSEQQERFNFVPNTRAEIQDALELEMQSMVDEQPYPIKFIVGQAAYAETMSVLGSTDLDAGNPT